MPLPTIDVLDGHFNHGMSVTDSISRAMGELFTLLDFHRYIAITASDEDAYFTSGCGRDRNFYIVYCGIKHTFYLPHHPNYYVRKKWIANQKRSPGGDVLLTRCHKHKKAEPISGDEVEFDAGFISMVTIQLFADPNPGTKPEVKFKLNIVGTAGYRAHTVHKTVWCSSNDGDNRRLFRVGDKTLRQHLGFPILNEHQVQAKVSKSLRTLL
jgi:hypothetical protein